MNKINLIKHNIPRYSNNVLGAININIRFNIKEPPYMQIKGALIGIGWGDPFGFGFKLMQAMNRNILIRSLEIRNFK